MDNREIQYRYFYFTYVGKIGIPIDIAKVEDCFNKDTKQSYFKISPIKTWKDSMLKAYNFHVGDISWLLPEYIGDFESFYQKDIPAFIVCNTPPNGRSDIQDILGGLNMKFYDRIEIAMRWGHTFLDYMKVRSVFNDKNFTESPYLIERWLTEEEKQNYILSRPIIKTNDSEYRVFGVIS